MRPNPWTPSHALTTPPVYTPWVRILFTSSFRPLTSWRIDFPTFGSLPNFPFIGGAAAVAGFNSPECGSCWELTYNGTSINVLAIDHADSGFNIALGAFNVLTDGNGVSVGRINAQAQQVDPSQCGL